MNAASAVHDRLPANARSRKPIPSAKRASGSNLLHRAWAAVEMWFYRQQMKDREAYVAQSQDLFEVERRLQHLALRRYY